MEIWALDFDGVICDSVPECFVSSLVAAGLAENWPAAAQLWPNHPAVPGFRRQRPWIRSGEEYLLLQERAAAGLHECSSQAEFDQVLLAAGPDGMADRKQRLYRVRDRALSQWPDLWQSLNPLFPGWIEFLAHIPKWAWIVSTKRATFIEAILQAQGVTWPSDQILETGARAKADLMAQAWPQATEVWLIDDQPSHFADLRPNQRGILASWGYAARGSFGPHGTWTLAETLEHLRSRLRTLPHQD